MLEENKLIQRIREKACDNDKYGGCSQAVLAALQEELNIGDSKTLKSATVLPGGGGWRGETCGALIGALMALGLVTGRENLENIDKYSCAMDISKDIIEGFKDELHETFGFKVNLKSTLCWDIQENIFGRSYNLAHQADRQAFLDDGGRTKKGCGMTCAVAAGVAARKLLELMRTSNTGNAIAK